MHLPINVKFPNNISKWQMGFNSVFKGLIVLPLFCAVQEVLVPASYIPLPKLVTVVLIASVASRYFQTGCISTSQYSCYSIATSECNPIIITVAIAVFRTSLVVPTNPIKCKLLSRQHNMSAPRHCLPQSRNTERKPSMPYFPSTFYCSFSQIQKY
jgi:hypothetical protein